jgi:hypothetical protein
VTGFLATEWNGFGHYYTVRQRDAHAWVEVYFPGSGWITVDPTPPEPASAVSSWPLAGAMDSMRLRWEQLIIQYSAADQLSVIQDVRHGGDTLWNKTVETAALHLKPLSEFIRATMGEWTRLAGRAWNQALLMIFVIGTSFCLLLLLLRHRSSHGLTPAGSAGHVIAAQWYGRMLSLAAARGFRKPSSHTPMEFARHIERHWADGFLVVNQLTELYYRVRFGELGATEEDRLAAEALLRELEALQDPIR